ncbi:MAG: hypothetical protein R3A12_11495 [Ignavibacteria bacterium]
MEIIYNTEIIDIANFNGTLNTVKDTTGKEWKAILLLLMQMLHLFRGKVLNRNKYTEKKLDNMEWSLAPFTVYLGLNKKVPVYIITIIFLGNDFLLNMLIIFLHLLSFHRSLIIM